MLARIFPRRKETTSPDDADISARTALSENVQKGKLLESAFCTAAAWRLYNHFECTAWKDHLAKMQRTEQEQWS